MLKYAEIQRNTEIQRKTEIQMNEKQKYRFMKNRNTDE